MPTGYTCDVQDGKITTLEDYAKTCARAFLWQSRDSNEKDLVKLVNDENTVKYYEKSLTEAEGDLIALSAMTDEDWQKLYDDEGLQQKKFEDDYNKRKAEELIRYTDMLEKVRAWNPPTDKHVDMKTFMIEQLESSIKFDCEGTYWKSETVPFETWKKTRLETTITKVKKNLADYERQISRKNEFVDWVNQLLESVKGK